MQTPTVALLSLQHGSVEVPAQTRPVRDLLQVPSLPFLHTRKSEASSWGPQKFAGGEPVPETTTPTTEELQEIFF